MPGTRPAQAWALLQVGLWAFQKKLPENWAKSGLGPDPSLDLCSIVGLLLSLDKGEEGQEILLMQMKASLESSRERILHTVKRILARPYSFGEL